jgi:hypothetical protein
VPVDDTDPFGTVLANPEVVYDRTPTGSLPTRAQR